MSSSNLENKCTISPSARTVIQDRSRDDNILSYGASTPRRGHHNRPFTPPADISSVSSEDASPRKRARITHSPEKLQEVPEVRTRESGGKKSNIEKFKSIVSERLASSIRKSLSSTFTRLAVEDRTHASNNTDESSSEDGIHLKKKPKQVHKGQDWKQFKPKHEDRIYAEILNKPYGTSVTAEYWIQEYKKNPQQATISLFQFIADVCGYQEFDINNVFEYEKENYSEVIDYMQKNPPEDLKRTGRYLMKTTSDWGIQSQEAVYEFFEHLLNYADESKLLCDYEMLRAIIPFVFGLSLSYIKPLKHTGIVLAAKMIYVVLKIEKKLQSKLNNEKSGRNRSELVDLRQYAELLSQTLEQLQKIIETNCYLSDHTLDKMKITCIEEMYKWFNIKPSLLNSSKFFRRLMVLVKDWSKSVRLAALATCSKLIETNTEESGHMKSLMANFMEVIGSRLYDSDITVATAAIKIHSRMLKINPDCVLSSSRETIILLIYGRNLDIARAAGDFLMQLFQIINEDEECSESNESIKQLIALAQVTEKDNQTALLVEALLYCCPQMQNWNELIELLLIDELSHKDQATLIDIMCHSAYMTIHGKAKIGRTMYTNALPKVKDAKIAIEAFLSKIHLLLKKYSNEPKLLAKLTDVLSVINFMDGSLFPHRSEIINVLHALRASFVKNKHLELLENISKIFAYLSDEACPFSSVALPLLSTLKEAVAETLYDILKTIKSNKMSEREAVKVEECLLKVSVLLTNNDMTELIDHESLFNDGLNTKNQTLTPMSIKHLISSSYHYLCWKLEEIIKDNSKSGDEFGNKITLLNSLREHFQEICFKILNSSTDIEVCRESFERICNIHITFRAILENPIKYDSVLKKLIPPILDRNTSVQLLDFAEKLLFIDAENTSQKLRRISMGNIINLAFLNVINYKLYGQIFQHYHKFNEPYGDIFRNAFNNMRAEAPILLVAVMLQTLVYCYKNIIDENSRTVGAEQLESAIHIRKLVKEYQIYISRYLEEAKLMLHMGINWAVAAEIRYGFFYFLRGFSSSLPENEKQVLLEMLDAKVPAENKENEFVEGFIRYLKFKSKKDTAKPKPNEEDDTFTDTVASGDYNIEDSSEVSDQTVS